MKRLLIIALAFLCVSCSNEIKSPGDNNSGKLAGMYKLYIAENQDSTGVWHEDPWTKGATGYIIYDGKGHMGVQINRSGYHDLKWLAEEASLVDSIVDSKLDSMTVDELKDAVRAFSSSYGYFGNYFIDDTADIVNHQRLSTTLHSPEGSTVRRAFSFNGDTVILRILNGNRRLKWIKQP